MVRVSFPAESGYTSTSTHDCHLGYFNSIEEAKIALRGLSPADFGGVGDYSDFYFQNVLTDTEQRDKSLAAARKYRKSHNDTWNKPAPLNWGE